MSFRRHAWIGNLAVASMSLTLALVGTELFVRLFPPLARRVEPRHAVSTRRTEPHPRGLYTMDGESVWRLTPGFTGRFVTSSFDIEVRANNRGLRDRELEPKPADTFRVLGLGDSFAFGWGVPLEASFFKRLEALLDGSRPEVAHEVINAGIPGYGTFEAERLLATVGLAYDPDLVLLAFYEGNDYLNNAAAPRQRAIFDGYLIDVKAPPSPARALARGSALFRLVEQQWSSVGEKRAFRRSIDKTKTALGTIKSTLAARAIPFAVVFIPDQDPAVHDRGALLTALDRRLRGEEFFAPRVELEEFCKQHGIGFHRLSPRFDGDREVRKLHLSAVDVHFNALGHELAADEIHAWLHANSWVFERGRAAPSVRTP